jgi:polyhydroxyalkanoate synthase
MTQTNDPRSADSRQASRPDSLVPPQRLGPRPLPLHLLLTSGAWTSASAGLPNWRALSPGFNPASPQASQPLPASLLPPLPDDLRASLEKADPSQLEQALGRVVLDRFEAFHRGVAAYRAHPYRRDVTDPPSLWREGSTDLLDYGGPADGPLLLAVPSLVNRGYVLDLSRRNSMLRYLSAAGVRVLMLDWGQPGPDESSYDVGAYVGRLLRAMRALPDLGVEGTPALLGYCMGGLLTVAAAALEPARVDSLVLMATPWDFHADGAPRAEVLAALHAVLAPVIAGLGAFPVDLIQSLFAWLDPVTAARKFPRFADMDPESEAARGFVALEDWLNDGIDLTPGVAAESLQRWYGLNETARGCWTVAGQVIEPSRITAPALVLVPEGDRIVPPGSARALGTALPQADMRSVALGHIGMAVGSRARAATWDPIAAWLLTRARH